MKRAAFSLIELVFAIVIISISVMTVPLMLQQSAKSDNFAMMQESILAARTKMGNILSYPWDDASIEENTTIIRVLDVVNGDSELARNGNSLRRKGHIQESKRRRLHDGNASVLTYPLGTVDTNITDWNDFDDKNATVIASGTDTATDNFDYLDKNLSLGTKVYYIDDKIDYNQTTIAFDFNVSTKASITNVNNSTNIKMIELEVGSLMYTPFIFRTFSCNIGQTLYLEKVAE